VNTKQAKIVVVKKVGVSGVKKRVDTIYGKLPRFVVSEAKMAVYNVNFQEKVKLGLGAMVLLGLIAISIFGSSFFITKDAYALTCTWTGSVDTNWSNSGNWTGCGGVIPGSADTVSFSGVTPSAPVDQVFSITSMSIEDSYTGDITLGANLTLNGDLTISGGTFTQEAGADVAITGTFSLTSGTYNHGAGFDRQQIHLLLVEIFMSE